MNVEFWGTPQRVTDLRTKACVGLSIGLVHNDSGMTDESRLDLNSNGMSGRHVRLQWKIVYSHFGLHFLGARIPNITNQVDEWSVRYQARSLRQL
jgi:hypothetical protein